MTEPSFVMSNLLEQVSAAALRALGRNREMEVVLRGKRMRVDGARVSVPKPGSYATGDELGLLRGRLDALALRSRYSDTECYNANRPAGKTANRLYSMLEQCRVEALGARHMAGVAANLEAREAWRLRDAGVRRIPGSLPDQRLETVALIARYCLGAPLPPAASAALGRGYSDWIDPSIVQRIEALTAVRHDQAAFAARAAGLIDALELARGDPPFTRDKSSDEKPARQEKPAESAPTHEAPPWDPVRGVLVRQPVVTKRRGARNPPEHPEPYRAYTTQFDEVTDAAALDEAGEIVELRRQLDENMPGELYSVTRLAHRLQRHLLAQQTRAWQFDLEEGLLDASRLPRVIVHPLESLAFKQETETRFIDTAVGLLIDNSGSMRGRPITMAAVCAEILGRTLERCGVKSEILGFTTRNWRGGRVRDKWLDAGRPERPGRLNELRHIIYKRADVPWRRARQNLGLMLSKDLLKENIDGEALLWAHQRLLARPEPRRILMMISDGAPVDDATMAANDHEYLERHLRSVIGWIETRSPVQLLAIGIGHDVTRYYRNAITLLRPEDLGGTMINQLLTVLDETEGLARNRGRRRRLPRRTGTAA